MVILFKMKSGETVIGSVDFQNHEQAFNGMDFIVHEPLVLNFDGTMDNAFPLVLGLKGNITDFAISYNDVFDVFDEDEIQEQIIADYKDMVG